jgi:ATP-binding cassette subfamily B protein
MAEAYGFCPSVSISAHFATVLGVVAVENHRQNAQIWSLLRQFVRAERRDAVGGVLLLLLAIGAGLLQPWPLKILVDNVLGPQGYPRWFARLVEPFGGGKLAGVAAVALGYLLIHIAQSLTHAAGTTILVRAGLKMVYALRCRLYEHLQRLGLYFHDNRAVGESLYRVTADTFSIQTIFNNGIVPLMTATVTLVGILVILLRFDVILTLLALAIAPLLVVAIRFFNARIARFSVRYYEDESRVTSITQESLAAIRTVQAFAREEDEQRRFDIGAQRSLQTNVQLTKWQVLSSVGIGLITTTGIAAMIVIGGQRVLEDRLSIGEVLVFIAYVGMLYGPMATMSGIAATFTAALERFRRVQEILATMPTIHDAPDARPLTTCRGVVKFESVTFGYEPNRPVLKNVSFEANPNQIVALVGASGAGKTTLLSLLLRFYDPQEGQILVDGEDIRRFQYRSLRRHIAIVPQEPVLFATTVRENIAYGRPDATLDEIVEAAKLAEAHEFIIQMPQGYDTPIGERGVLLSVGQRQRLALARAFLKNAPILILDEPTSALDAETEMHIVQCLKKLRQNRAVFVVAHRLSTVRVADVLLVLSDGRIVERGTHDELLAKNGAYAKLHELQFAGASA